MKLYNTKTNNIFILLIATLLLSCKNDPPQKKSRVAQLPYFCETTFTPHWLEENDPRLDTFHTVSPFSLINQEGEEVTERTFENKIYVTDFFFTTCPGICPKMTKNMGVLQDEFKNDDLVLLLSHSVTPTRDSVSVLKAYAESKDVISGKWHLVTGTQEAIYKLGRKDYFIEEDMGLEMEEDDFLHTENFVLIDKNKHLRGIYNGLNKTSIKQLIANIRLLETEN